MFHKKAQVTLYLAFLFTAIIIILITGVLAPMGVRFGTQMYETGEQLIIDSNASVQGINDPVVRASVEGVLGTALDAGEMNIEVNADLFRYSWIFIVLLTGLVVFLFTRRLVEVQSGTGGFVG